MTESFDGCLVIDSTAVDKVGAVLQAVQSGRYDTILLRHPTPELFEAAAHEVGLARQAFKDREIVTASSHLSASETTIGDRHFREVLPPSIYQHPLLAEWAELAQRLVMVMNPQMKGVDCLLRGGLDLEKKLPFAGFHTDGEYIDREPVPQWRLVTTFEGNGTEIIPAYLHERSKGIEKYLMERAILFHPNLKTPVRAEGEDDRVFQTRLSKFERDKVRQTAELQKSRLAYVAKHYPRDILDELQQKTVHARPGDLVILLRNPPESPVRHRSGLSVPGQQRMTAILDARLSRA